MTEIKKDYFYRKDKTAAVQEVDQGRRQILFGSLSLLGSIALSGCEKAETLKKSNRNIGVNGRDYSIAQPQGPARELTIEARSSVLELTSNHRVEAWTYGDKLPGSEIRVREGERLRISVRNGLPIDTSVHWHGIPQRGSNNMDGVPGVTQQPIRPGESFVYDFIAEPAGSFIYHSHSGLQLERGLYAPLIIEAKQEMLEYDREYTLMLDDWLIGLPEEVFTKLKRGIAMHPMQSSGRDHKGMPIEDTSGGSQGRAVAQSMDMEAGPDVNYATFLINGRSPEEPAEFKVKRGERVRLRLMNPSGSTMFRFAIGGHKLLVTHADSLPVQPVEVDTLEISMGERYDLLITATNDGVWPIVAISTDDPLRGARAILRYENNTATAPPSDARPKELNGRLLDYEQLQALDDEEPSAPDRKIDMLLSGQMMPYEWKINGKLFEEAEPIEIRAGERVRVTMINNSLMRHPMHLHGHSFRLVKKGSKQSGPIKDTVFVEPKRILDFEFFGDNPGDWLFHCHHAYHMEAGMARIIKYV